MMNKIVSLLCFAIIGSGACFSAHAESESEFLVFVGADNLERQSVSEPELQTSDFTPTVDLVYSYNNGPWRILGEYFFSDDENELERLQVGYNFQDDNMIWAGRFHQPISAWNHRYHHGAYLQPSIARPSIENWEDDNGVLPAHVTGAMIDTGWTIGKSSRLRMLAAAGFAPIIENGALEPFDLLDPDDGGTGAAGSINIAFFPDYVGETNFGVIGGYAEIAVSPSVLLGNITNIEVRQKVLGAQGNWDSDTWQIIGAAYYVDHRSYGSSIDVNGFFASGYVQVAHTFGQDHNIYARLERTRNPESDYLMLFPYYVHQRELVGTRWDFAERQALHLEISSNRVLADKFSEYRIQWSAIFP